VSSEAPGLKAGNPAKVGLQRPQELIAVSSLSRRQRRGPAGRLSRLPQYWAGRWVDRWQWQLYRGLHSC
jgi:hypothetical protein